MIKDIYIKAEPCETCKGAGAIREDQGMGEMRWATCSACRGARTQIEAEKTAEYRRGFAAGVAASALAIAAVKESIR